MIARLRIDRKREDTMATESRPRVPMDIMKEHSAATAEAFQGLRKAVAGSGPLPAHIQELIVCGAFVVTGQQRAFLTHARRALEGGASTDELRQAVLVTLGANATFPQVVQGLSWVEEATGR
jgi:4-carboxymuconolactone decarboxylase